MGLGMCVLGIIGICFLIYRYMATNKSNQEVSQQATATNTEIQNKQYDSVPSNQQPEPTRSTTVPVTPFFSKSSGNNGPIPANVLVNFICNSEPGTTCQIILTSGNKKIALPEQEVKDNGRGQWFTSWDWTSITGKWNVIARAKNKQGGISDSINQTLEVK